MTIPQSRIVAIIGPSGCGKSTLLRSLNRMNDLVAGARVEGDVMLDGSRCTGRVLTWWMCAGAWAWSFSGPIRFRKALLKTWPTAAAVWHQPQGTLDEIVERSLKIRAIWDEAKDKLQQSALSLSGGQQQRLCIARALAGGAEVILDG